MNFHRDGRSNGGISKLPLVVSMGVILLLITFRMQPAYGWDLGWYSSDPVDYYGVGSWAMVVGGLPDSDYYFDAVSQSFDGNGNALEVYLEDYDNGYVDAFYYFDDTPGEFYSGDCSLSTSDVYIQEVYWDSSDSSWIFYNSGCSDAYAVYDNSAYGYVADGYDYMQSNDGTASDFSSNGIQVEFDPSLGYEYSFGHWYTSNSWDYYMEDPYVPTGSGSVGADYSCSTPWIDISSSYGGPWSGGYAPSGGWACEG